MEGPYLGSDLNKEGHRSTYHILSSIIQKSYKYVYVTYPLGCFLGLLLTWIISDNCIADKPLLGSGVLVCLVTKLSFWFIMGIVLIKIRTVTEVHRLNILLPPYLIASKFILGENLIGLEAFILYKAMLDLPSISHVCR